ncbi:MAG: hypothetical protein KDA85_15785, partial [Planctomycetaceae bacterium]|nr:hypothetical protein [Planctomycetaceae bacterium]
LPEMIEHGVTGFLAEPADAVSLAGHLMSLCQDLELRKAVCDSAAAMACSRFSLDTMLDSYRRLYREVLEGVAS